MLAWAYTIYQAWQMETMDMGMTMLTMPSWGWIELLLLCVMWVIMMIAMMLPSASPMILMYLKTLQRSSTQHSVPVLISMFVLGYLVIWTGFSALISVVQWALHKAALLSPMMVSTSNVLGGLILIVAGLYQWTPYKHACLRRCRSPLGFIMTQWREGINGAFVMGLRHGLFCLGCCWALMALLFVTGVMNLLWIAALSVLVLIEKIIPTGEKLARWVGVLILGYGILMLTRTIL